jgi:DNA modification methylase
MKWPADKVERMSVKALIPYARNARTHSDEQIAQIAASMQEWGWTMPILVDEESVIIAGHGRLSAANKLGIDEVPVMVAVGWTDAQKRAYTIADNQLTANAGWHDEFLRLEVQDLRDWEFDCDLLGFSDLESIVAEKNDGLTDPDDVPPIAEVAVSKLNDIWTLGRHRLACGDCTDADTVSKCLDGVEPHLMVTDPPYGVNYDPDWRNRADRADGTPIGARAIGTVSNDDVSDWGDAWVLFPGDVAYVWHADTKAGEVADSLLRAGIEVRSQIIWAKTRFVISRGHYHVQHEPCWYAVRNTGHWQGDRTQSTLWTIEHRKSDTGHSTQKPVECMKRPIQNNSSPGQAVYDPFIGSGTTMIAAEQEGRHCYGIEINPLYCDVAIKRWQDFTGNDALLDGKTFNEVANG